MSTRSSDTAAPTSGEETAAGSDFLDSAAELAALAATPALEEAVRELGEQLHAPFANADALALEHQRSFRRIALRAATFGTAGILLAISGFLAQIFGAETIDNVLFAAETVCLFIAAVAVVRGLVAYRHENWLLARFRAERLRTLKFYYLTDPMFWLGDSSERETWRRRLRADVESVEALGHDDIRAFAAIDEVPAFPLTGPSRQVDPALLDALIDYYERKRLAPQRAYFRAASRGHGSARTLPLVFFGSVVLAIVQTVLKGVGLWIENERLGHVATWLAACAMAIPVVWAGMRTYQGASESSRNATRSRARHTSLIQLTDRLLSSRGDPLQALWTMRLTEFILQNDQREWLRLLREAEWYG